MFALRLSAFSVGLTSSKRKFLFIINERFRRGKTEIKDKPRLSPVQTRVKELRQLTQQLQVVHPNVLAKALHRGLLFQNQELLAINKPYGVAVHGGPGVRTSIADVLPILAKMNDGMRAGSELHLCHRLDKETTGAMLLARSEEAANRIQELFRTHQVQKKYWVLSVGVPVPSEGVIDIPILEKESTGPQPHYKMTLSPVYRVSEGGEGLTRVRANRQAHSAATRYRVLGSAGGCSLVELHPITGVKHQIRVHMAYALGCTILGDHKYAHWNRLAPQKLPEGVLRKLGLEQSKARHLPLHLHACHLTLPGVGGHNDISVNCPLPKFFIRSLQRLKIPLPERA
ncbi:hypothetical protein AGOR_G00152600 [Albula goreensis]|uniref:Pseudouridylate synthase RPUSD4, mitochondrial n=1 Tax=Albula goreensis TaxID=1534307 RepID=A0A8T3D6M1_9TELE|nr:hypothetical protein AGOR_G00152600 [Albula goreensis]